ncbi:MAG: hypothetical protein ACR2K6_09630 [Solirubrobacterales bacterium]
MEVQIYEPVTIDPIAKVQSEALRAEIELLTEIARLAASGEIELLWQAETQIEFLGQYMIPGGGRSELAAAGIRLVEGPIEYSRMISPIHPFSGETWRTVQVDFLKSLDHPRFRELRRACGADQGSLVNGRQLKDAFHIWSAEVAGATHFMTTDFKLIRLVRSFKSCPPLVKVVRPSELLADLGTAACSA